VDALCAWTLTGPDHRQGAHACLEVWSPMAYCPRSSLPADVLAWLAARLAHLLPSRPPGTGGTPPLSLEVRLDAVGSALLDGLSYRRAGRAVGISKTAVGDSLDLLLGSLAVWGPASPTGPSPPPLRTCASGFRDGPSRPGGRGGRAGHPGTTPSRVGQQKVVYDAKRHTTPPRALPCPLFTATCCGVDGGWPGSCHEHELLQLAGLQGCWTASRSPACWTGDSAGWPRGASTGTHRSGPPHHRPAPPGQRADNRLQAGLRALVEQSIAHLAGAWALRHWRGLLYRVRDVFRAAGALICLCRWLHRVPT
jgi:hypothetical protein